MALGATATAKWNYQFIEMTVSTKFEANTAPWGLRLQDGSVVVPEVVAIASTGIEYKLKFTGFRSGNRIFLTSNSIPRGTKLQEIEIRCATPVEFSSMQWISYMPEDTKTGNP